MKLSNITDKISRFAGRTGLVVKKHSPEILMTVGVVGIVAATVMACKATLKVEEVLEEQKHTVDMIHDAKEKYSEDQYSEADAKKDLTTTYIKTGLKFVKLYAPAVAVGVFSIVSMLCAHNIMRKRNLALVAAYTGIEEAFSNYRKRVVDELGEEADNNFRYGITKEKVTNTVTDENGEKHKVKETVKVVNSDPSMYSRFFDESSTQWSKTPEYNLTFLKCQQAYFNNLLKARGHVFLNEVYDALGIPRSQAGAIVGWVKGAKDDFIDFGIFDVNRPASRDFVNGYERSILLDFNVDGVIYDKI